MARDIGPDMLANLERRRGEMGESAYTARRIEIEELIRKGKAVEVSPLARAGQWALVVLGLAGGLFVATSSGEPIWAVVIAAACLLLARWIGRP